MTALQELTSEPVFMTIEEHAQLQEATPTSFEGHAPVLRLKLEGVRCSVLPESAIQVGESSGSIHPQNGNGSHSTAQQGTLWVTEGQVSFLPPSGKGFSLQYPSIALHAVSRTLPSSLEAYSSSSSSSLGCLYCQLEGEQEDDEDEEEQSSFSELWILPADQDALEPLFEALSYCASLHPSQADGEDEGGGHPFAGVGPFGTGILGGQEDQDQMDADGAFDDAEEDREETGDVQLSETGRATLAHLDSLLEGAPNVPPLSPVATAAASSPPASFHSADPRKAAVQATNSLILVHLPDEIFTHPPLAASLLDLLHAFGNLASWTPLPSFGRALIVYEQVEGAKRAKEALDRLLLPLVDEDGENEQVDDPAMHTLQDKSDVDDTAFLRAYFGPMSVLHGGQEEGDDLLAVPTTDRNFLISPPGSPPVGWEPIKEDPPNRETLADDLIRALGSLRDKGLGVQGHQPKPLRESSSSSSSDGNGTTSSSSKLLPPPSVVIAPSQATLRSRHPLAKQTYNAGEVEDGEATISIPGVVVQSMDQESDQEDELDQRLNKGLSISSVKATVESMKGPYSSSKITPTGRPPLA